ncbi:MAG: response regulator, partial [Gammaproteobacteria bacterium]|nr:response regulator [Gammaproteobacteria bacterium]
EIISSRMRPFSDSTQGYKRMVRDISNTLNKKVNLIIKGEDTPVDRDILEKLDAPLNHMIRNAIDHGIEMPEQRLQKGKPETGTITVTASHQSGRLIIEVKDDGRGVDIEDLRDKVLKKNLVNNNMAENLSKSELLDFLFLPSFSTRNEVTELSGRGVGLDVVHSALQEVRGKLHADTELDQGMQINMELPLTLSVIRSLMVSINNELYAFPLAKIQSLVTVPKKDISIFEDKQYISINGKHIGLIHCAQILGINNTPSEKDDIPVIIIGDWNTSYGLVVDELIGERGLAVRALNKKLGKIKDISSAAITDSGEPVLIFDIDDLQQSIHDIISGKDLYKINANNMHETVSHKHVLVVDDSLTVREIEKKLLESRGYLVDIAIDGVDGWNTVRNGNYDLVISDIDMPRMNGIEFITMIKNDVSLRNIPVMMVSYKDRPEDKQKGLEAGADYYLTKGSFHDDTLLDAVVDLIGEAKN